MDRSRSPAYRRSPAPSLTPASWYLGPSTIFAAWKLSRRHEANRNVSHLAHGCVDIIGKILRMERQIDRLRLVAKPGCTHVSLRLSLSLIVCLMSVCAVLGCVRITQSAWLDDMHAFKAADHATVPGKYLGRALAQDLVY